MTMNNETLKVFSHTYAGIELRTILDDQDKPWFIAADVCKGLGLKGSSTRHIEKLCDFERDTVNRIHCGMARNGKPLPLVSESGFYKLVMRSDKEEATAFQRWVCEEVLPEIRKTGSYEAGDDAPTILKDLADALNPLDVSFLEAKEYCQIKDIPEEAKSFIGKIATRLCIEQDMPKRWTKIDKKVVKKYHLKYKKVGQYPVTVLDQAYAEYCQGVTE